MPHVHKITLPTGEVLITGPDEDTVDAPEDGDELLLEGELRRRPQGKSAVKASELADLERDEAEQASIALAKRDPSMLPAYARQHVYGRMYESSKAWLGGDEPKARAAAWRAVCQKYGLRPQKRQKGPELDACVESLMAEGAAEDEAFAICQAEFGKREGRKYLGTTSGNQGSAKLVRFTDAKPNVPYLRVEDVEVPGLPGVRVQVGIMQKNRRAILSCVVPNALVSDDPGNAGHVTFVRRHLDRIWAAGKGRGGSVVTTEKRAAQELRRPAKERRVADWTRFAAGEPGQRKFVSDPREATRRIAYAENYVPWEVDFQGEYATEEKVERMAHEFLKRGGGVKEMHQGWTTSDGSPIGYVVESFVARRGDPDFTAGAWVTGTEFHPEVWSKIVSGEYRGNSIGGRWAVRPVFRRAH